MAWRKKNPEAYRSNQRAYARRARERARLFRVVEGSGPQSISSSEADALRRHLSDNPPSIDGDTDGIAYFRGYVAGHIKYERAAALFEKHKDLAFRIASQEHRKWKSRSSNHLSYEDCVSVACEATLLVLSRRGEETTRAMIATSIRNKLADEYRNRFGSRRTPEAHLASHKIAGASDVIGEDGESMISELATAREGEKGVDVEPLAYMGMDDRQRSICCLLGHGFRKAEIGRAFGIDASRVSQILKEIREKYGEDLIRALG